MSSKTTITHICDRCGKQIPTTQHELNHSFISRRFQKKDAQAIMKSTELYLPSSTVLNADQDVVEIKFVTSEHEKKFDLCNECRKDFLEFMKK